MLIPQAMAYAVLAGMRPEHGLFAGLGACVAYPFFSTSPAIAIGPASLQAILMAETALGAGLAPQDSGDDYNEARYLEVAARTCLLIGLWQLGLGLFRFGALIKFLSKPVLKGFHFGVAITTGSSQLARILGIRGLPSRNRAIMMWWDVGSNLLRAHVESVLFSAACLGSFFILEWVKTFLLSLPIVKR